MARKEDPKFRGMWTARVGSPSGYAFKFIPSPPAQKPKTKANAPPPEPVVEVGEVLSEPPREASQNRYRNYRGYISPEGTCYNNMGKIIGYIDDISGQAGSSAEEYLGCIRQDHVIENAAEEKLGDLDMGKATIKSTKGSTVADIDGTGSITGNSGSFLGQFEPFGYKNLRVIAVYLLLLDPGMLNEIEG